MSPADAPTIAQVHATQPESLWAFLAALPGTMEAQIWYALILGGVIGMIAHYGKARATGLITGNPIDYFFRDNVWRSLAALGAIAAELFGESAGLFTNEAGQFVGWGLVILSGIKSGYVGDSILNKGAKPEQPASAYPPPPPLKPGVPL